MILLCTLDKDFTRQDLQLTEIHAYRINHLNTIKETLRTQIFEEDTLEDDLKSIPVKSKISTVDKTFDLWQQSKSITEIATERKLSIQTITQHIGKLIALQKIDITQVLSNKKILQLQKLFDDHQNKTLTEIKAETSDEISWEDLRIFKAYLDIDKKE